MKLYLAAVYSNQFTKGGNCYNRLNESEKPFCDSLQYILESYHYVHRQRYVDNIRANGQRIFLDSGAFSAFTQGVEIDLRGYCDYIKRNHDIIDVVDGALLASVLDRIGQPDGGLGTYRNQLTMEAQGVRPLPCFHYGEDERYLEFYIANYSYITLGGMVPISTAQLYHWLDRIWERHLTDGAGRPRTKVHGFGLTVVDLMERYPWYSVDSSSWVQIALRGNIIHPDYGMVSVSKESPNRKEAGYHLDNMNPAQREALLNIIRGIGFDPDRLRDSTYARRAFNFWAYQEINRRTNVANKTFKAEQPELF